MSFNNIEATLKALNIGFNFLFRDRKESEPVECVNGTVTLAGIKPFSEALYFKFRLTMLEKRRD